MEQPPPYRPKKSNTGLIIGLVIGALVICCGGGAALLGGGAWFAFKKVGPMAKCSISLEAMAHAVTAYADAHGGKMPDADKWQDQVKDLYAKEIQKSDAKEQPFGTIPAEGEWGCEADGNVTTGIAFNAELSGKKLADIKDQSNTIMLFEVKEHGRNLNAKYDATKVAEQPPERFGDPALFTVTVDGDTKMIGKGGKHVNINFKGQ
ncbi:MAG TPA: hypothetical protein VK934_08805 [Fimbriimonas sp.]|nr:hypothetical protein [Fimbriimonas sp.]